MGSFLLNPYMFPAIATGGIISSVDDYMVHVFTSSDNFTLLKENTTVEYLIVAGGGGGGTDYYQDRSAGGGGAGGLLYGFSKLSTIGDYPIVVGAGGAGGFAGTLAQHAGGLGTNSSAFNKIAIRGGGGGGHSTSSNTPGLAGGSGGGSTHDDTNGPAGAGTTGQGYGGGTAGNEQGGPGLQSTISGYPLYYAAGGSASSSGSYTGGGGGGSDGSGENGSLIGGSGIGGNSASSTGVVQGTAAVQNTGSGGGASRETIGGSGSSGIVIIRYPVSKPAIVADGLVSYIDVGKLYSGKTTPLKLYDLSGYNNGFDSLTSLTYGTNPPSIIFNGSSSYCYKTTDFTSLNSSNFSIIFFTKLVSNTVGLFFGIGRDAADSDTEAQLHLTATGALYFWDYSGGATGFTATSTTTLSTGQWYCVAFVKNGISGTFYVNGVSAGTATATANKTWTANDYSIGKDVKDNNKFLNGEIGDYMVYNVSLTSDQVLQNFNALKSKYGL